MSKIHNYALNVDLRAQGIEEIVAIFMALAEQWARQNLLNPPMLDSSRGSPETLQGWHDERKSHWSSIVESRGLAGLTGGIVSLSNGKRTVSPNVSTDTPMTKHFTDGIDDADSYQFLVVAQGYQLTLTAQSGAVSSDFETLGVYRHPYVTDGQWESPETAQADFEALASQIDEVISRYSKPQIQAPPAPFRVFLGHGGDGKWKTIKRMLEDRSFAVEAFESEERAGYSTLETVDLMIRSCAVGVVVMSGVDKMADGSLRARENVVHEVGYCQGALGIRDTIVLLENDVSEFSNINGLTQIRFPSGDIGEAIEPLVAALTLRKRAKEGARERQ